MPIRKFSKVLAQRARPNKLCKYAVVCYAQDLELPYPRSAYLCGILEDCKINVYKVGTRCPSLYRVYANNRVKDFAFMGQLLDYIKTL